MFSCLCVCFIIISTFLNISVDYFYVYSKVLFFFVQVRVFCSLFPTSASPESFFIVVSPDERTLVYLVYLLNFLPPASGPTKKQHTAVLATKKSIRVLSFSICGDNRKVLSSLYIQAAPVSNVKIVERLYNHHQFTKTSAISQIVHIWQITRGLCPEKGQYLEHSWYMQHMYTYIFTERLCHQLWAKLAIAVLQCWLLKGFPSNYDISKFSDSWQW